MPTEMRSDGAEARRSFLAKCGKFAVVTPPAITLILAESNQRYAVALSGRPNNGHPNNGFGNGGGDGVPGNSGNNPSPNANQKLEDEIR